MQGRCCILRKGNEWKTAPALVAAALGIDFVSGQALAAFYGQLGRASWLGVLVSALVFGCMTGFIAAQGRCSGAGNVGGFFARLPGGGLGKGAGLLYGLVVILAGGMLMTSAGRMAALALPVKRADWLGSAAALLIALVLAIAGGRALRAGGGILVLVMLGFELALLLFARLPDTPRYAIELRLRDNWIAALGFALFHTCACLCVVVGMLLKMCAGRLHPARLGSRAGVLFALLLAVGNAVLMRQDERILALQLPFVALSGDWGSAGFYLNAGLCWLFCVFSLAGLIYGVLPMRGGANSIGK